MTDQPESPSSPEAPKLRRRLVTAAPPAASKVKFASPAAEGVEVAKPRFLTPELQAKLAQEQEEAARRAAEQAEADRIAAEKAAAEQEAARIAAEKEAARIAAEEEAARIKAEQEAAEAARIAAEKEAARMAAEEERARLAAEQEQKEAASKPMADPAVDAQIQDALAKIAEAQKALADAIKREDKIPSGAKAVTFTGKGGSRCGACSCPGAGIRCCGSSPGPRCIHRSQIESFEDRSGSCQGGGSASRCPGWKFRAPAEGAEIPPGPSTCSFCGVCRLFPACACRGGFPHRQHSRAGNRRNPAACRGGNRPGNGCLRR